MLIDILTRRIEIDWKKGKKLNIQELNVKDWREMVEIEKIEDPIKQIDGKVRFVLRCLNRNQENIKIQLKDLEDVNLSYINAVWTLLLVRMSGIANDPN